MCHNLIKMEKQVKYERIRKVYESFMDYVCEDESRIASSENVMSIWKCSNESFLLILNVFFENVNSIDLIPSSEFHLDLIEELSESNNKEMLEWVNNLNMIFSERIQNAKKTFRKKNSSKPKNVNENGKKRKIMEMINEFEVNEQELQKKVNILETSKTMLEAAYETQKIMLNNLETTNSDLKIELDQTKKTLMNIVSFVMDQNKKDSKNLERNLKKLSGISSIASI